MSGSDNFLKEDKRPSTSLPLYYAEHRSELCTLGSRPGMECVPLRSPAEPSYHYHHVTDQTKSLQELQNEVGALLEFRDLVIETFPDLKSKMASSTTNSTITGIPSSSLASRREWEPGIRVRRKLTQKENSEITSSSLIRSRSNSHSGKKEPKSGEGNNGSVIQDSGFSTETSSSKETHSASSTTGAGQGNNVSNTTNRLAVDTEDELWNLLDVIHRKSNRLREEVETLQNLEREKCRTNNNLNNNNSSLAKTFQNQLDRVNKDDVQILRKERDRLLDKLTEYEAETLSGRIKASKMQDEVDALYSVKKDLEEQLKAALSQKLELNSRIHDLHLQFVNKSAPSSPESIKSRLPLAPGARKLSQDSTAPLLFQSPSQGGSSSSQLLKSRFNQSSFTPVIVKQQKVPIDDNLDAAATNDVDATIATAAAAAAATTATSSSTTTTRLININDVNNLGRLDGLVSSPNRTNKVRVADSKKIAAILLETNIIELQRHLLTITVQNQVLQQRLEQATRSRIFLNTKLEKSKEEIEDLKFQLEERTIELEGTKAQLRVIESKSNNKSAYSPEHNRSSSGLLSSPSRDLTLRLQSSQVSTPSMKAMVPLAMEEMLQHSSSTESAQDHTERDSRTCPETPKRRPSKIPLPGTKGYVAPKPPSGRNFVASQKNMSTSGPPSNRSLNKSTGSLYMKSTGPSSINKKDSLNRPDSAQSWRKETSLEKSRSSSIPVSAKSSPVSKQIIISSSPLPKAKRDSLTTRVKNLDSLSRMQTSASNNSLNKSTSKKDLSSSFTTGQLRDRKQAAVTVRRVSSATVSRNADQNQQSADNNGVGENVKIHRSNAKSSSSSSSTSPSSIATVTTIESTQSMPSRDLIREYFAKTRYQPPPIFRPTFTPVSVNSETAQVELAYKHPILLMEDDNICSVVSSVFHEKNREVEVKYIDDNSIELLDAKDDQSDSKESLIVPKTKITGFASIKSNSNGDNNNKCRLVGKVNPNIIKTWEQLSGNCAKSNQKTDKISLTTVTSSDNSSDKQSCLLYYRNQYNLDDDSHNFHVNKIHHTDSSFDGDFYDSIDEHLYQSKNIEDLMDDDEYVPAAGEGMADFTSLDKKKLMWSIDIE